MMVPGAPPALRSRVVVARGKLKGWAARMALLFGSVYFVLVVIEIVIESQQRFDAKKQTLSVRGMLKADPDFGYTTVPNSSVMFDDGVLQIPMSVNSLGQRDDDPADPTAIDDDLLLLGDSFAFGLGLPREDTISSAFERQSEGKVTVYNTGVPGWGPPQARLTAERLPFVGPHVVYLYYVNDGRYDNVMAGSITVREGVMVPRHTFDGRKFTDEQLDLRISQMLRERSAMQKTTAWLRSVLPLTRLTTMVKSFRDPQLRLTGLQTYQLTDELRARLFADVEGMAAAAGDKHFFVVTVPARGEALSKTWSPATQAVIDGLRERGIEVHEELLQRLENDAYLVHDGHFAAKGAAQTAELLLEIVSDPSTATPQ